MKKHARLACTAADHERIGVSSQSIEQWEDGIRTDGSKGSYEWWYFDSKLNDGSSLVIVFFSGPMFSFEAGFRPHTTFTLTKPDGTRYDYRVDAPISDSSFSKEKCDIKIGTCTCKGDLNTYDIEWKNDKVDVNVHLRGNVPSWRPGCGQILFDEKEYFAWLPSVPEGDITVSGTVEGQDADYTGTGYHDHNWGDIPMFMLMHHWYWGRAKIGAYQTVTSYITATGKYSYDATPVFMIAKDGKILADKPEKYLTYREEELCFIPETGKHVANKLIYDYDDGGQRFKITFCRESDIELIGMDTQLTKLQYVGAWLIGLRGSYHRMCGTVTLERYENGGLVETVTSPALWEQMYFGKDIPTAAVRERP